MGSFALIAIIIQAIAAARAVAVNRESIEYPTAAGLRIEGFTAKMYAMARNVISPPLSSADQLDPFSVMPKKRSTLSRNADISTKSIGYKIKVIIFVYLLERTS